MSRLLQAAQDVPEKWTLIALIGFVDWLVVYMVIDSRRHAKLPPEEDTGHIIEEWEAFELPDHLLIAGMVSCQVGRVIIRLYDGEGESRRYLGTATGTVYEPHHFYSAADGVRKSDSLSIEYAIHDYREE